ESAEALRASADAYDTARPLRGGDRRAQRCAAGQLPAGFYAPGADQRGVARDRGRAAGRPRPDERRLHGAAGGGSGRLKLGAPYTPARSIQMKAIQIEEFGGPEVMTQPELPAPWPADATRVL